MHPMPDEKLPGRPHLILSLNINNIIKVAIGVFSNSYLPIAADTAKICAFAIFSLYFNTETDKKENMI